MSKHKQRGKPGGKFGRSSRAQWIVAGLAVVLVVVAAVVLRSPPAAPTSAPDSSSNPVATNVSTNVVAILPAGPERLVGNWLRPDGGYVLQIRSATADGKLDARYLNPNSINVARAEWRRKDAALQVFVELTEKLVAAADGK